MYTPSGMQERGQGNNLSGAEGAGDKSGTPSMEIDKQHQRLA